MSKAIQSNGPGANTECFATTHWSVVLLADHSSSPAASGALEKLCQSYWYPVYAFVRRRGSSPHDAQDLTQEFFSRLLKRNSFADADPAKGRFRSFLLGALKHFLADDLVYTHGNGKRQSKAEYIAAVTKGPASYESFKESGINIRIYGKVAVLTGLVDVKMVNAEPYRVRTLEVYEEHNGRWQLAQKESVRVTRQPDQQ